MSSSEPVGARIRAPGVTSLIFYDQNALHASLERVDVPDLQDIFIPEITIGFSAAALEGWKNLPMRCIRYDSRLTEHMVNLISISRAWEVNYENWQNDSATELERLLRIPNIKKITVRTNPFTVTPPDLASIAAAAAQSNVRVLITEYFGHIQAVLTDEQRSDLINPFLAAILKAKSLMYVKIGSTTNGFFFNEATQNAMASHAWLKIVDASLSPPGGVLPASFQALVPLFLRKKMAFVSSGIPLQPFAEQYRKYVRYSQSGERLIPVHDFGPRARTAVTRFFERDGDHAIVSRIAGFLNDDADYTLDDEIFVRWPQPARDGDGDEDGGAAA